MSLEEELRRLLQSGEYARSLLAMADACLQAGDCDGAERYAAEAEMYPNDDPDFTGLLLLTRSRLHCLGGRLQEAVAEAFKALLIAVPESPIQVKANLRLARMAEAMGHAVEALGFALAARASAIDGRHYALEFEASALLMQLIGRWGPATLAELASELGHQGVDLYQHVDRDEAVRLASGAKQEGWS